MLQSILCPHCHEPVNLEEALQHELSDEVKLQVSKKQEELRKQIESERMAIEEKTRKQAEEQFQTVLKELELEKKAQQDELTKARETEILLRREKNKFEDEKRAFELEKQRQLDIERGTIREEAFKIAAEQESLKRAELEKKLSDAQKANEDMQRKLSQGSGQLQGEVQELALELMLKENFPLDDIAPVEKGIHGADIIQHVKDRNGKFCGTILWESKRTKEWSETWIDKLKEDKRTLKADIPVIATQVLPKDVPCFTLYNDVWVCKPADVIGLTTALRRGLIQVAYVKKTSEGKKEKMEVVYDYLVGNEFTERVRALAETFISLREGLDQEKRAMVAIWSKREKQINRLVEHTSGVYGDLQGIVGGSLPQVALLELNGGNGSQSELEA